MSFKKRWFSGKITSTEGYEVSFKGRCGIIYEDQMGKVNIDSELLSPDKGCSVALYKDAMFLENGTRIDDPELCQKIVDRVVAACAYIHVDVDVGTP